MYCGSAVLLAFSGNAWVEAHAETKLMLSTITTNSAVCQYGAMGLYGSEVGGDGIWAAADGAASGETMRSIDKNVPQLYR
jgi:hypothetical protein